MSIFIDKFENISSEPMKVKLGHMDPNFKERNEHPGSLPKMEKHFDLKDAENGAFGPSLSGTGDNKKSNWKIYVAIAAILTVWLIATSFWFLSTRSKSYCYPIRSNYKKDHGPNQFSTDVKPPSYPKSNSSSLSSSSAAPAKQPAIHSSAPSLKPQAPGLKNALPSAAPTSVCSTVPAAPRANYRLIPKIPVKLPTSSQREASISSTSTAPVDPQTFLKVYSGPKTLKLASDFTDAEWHSIFNAYRIMAGEARLQTSLNNLSGLKKKSIITSDGQATLMYPLFLEVACRLKTVSEGELRNILSDRNLKIDYLFLEPCLCLYKLLPAERKQNENGTITMQLAKNPHFSDDQVQEIAHIEDVDARSLALFTFEYERPILFDRAVQMIAEDVDYGAEELANLLKNIFNLPYEKSAVRLSMATSFMALITQRPDAKVIANKATESWKGPLAYLKAAVVEGQPFEARSFQRNPEVAKLVYDFLSKHLERS